MRKETTKGSNLIIPVGSLDNSLPDTLVPILHSILPAHEIVTDVDAEGNEVEILGDPIANGTYRQRLNCAHLTQPKRYTKDTINSMLNATPVLFNPQETDVYGRDIPSPHPMSGRSFYFVRILQTAGIQEELRSAKEAWEQATGQTILYPEGCGMTEIEYPYYFASVEA